jgi:large subunit ribosomal protein L10
VLTAFARDKENEALKIKGAVISGRALSEAEVKTVLATMPGREELLAGLAGLLSGGPAMLYQILAAGPIMLYQILMSLKEKREKEANPAQA